MPVEVKQIMFAVFASLSVLHVVVDIYKTFYSEDEAPVDHCARSLAYFAAAFVWLRVI